MHSFPLPSVLSIDPLNVGIDGHNYKRRAAHTAGKRELSLEEKIVKQSSKSPITRSMKVTAEKSEYKKAQRE